MNTDNMEIDIVKINEIDDMLGMVLEHCWNSLKTPAKKRLFACSDSILEIPEYYAFCTAPRSVAMQIETHKKKYGCYVWMQSARPDLGGKLSKESYSREQMVNFVLKFTARGIIDISHYRMCGKAEDKTRQFMQLFKKELEDVEPELAKQMMPMCAYRNGLCTELHSCGYNTTKKINN